ncbi:insulinase family protein [Variovorax sp. ZS18.2.2]|uniref:M16 family metallopeptidase n=1 Tax=Variovorax sp. ZS18.2.2 TaxID=2971255 RepID=UPI0021515918|nr:pitrilysin family protein [Variovorax sp. ZS18.2.2]MCR6479588.1 insulinase family protein [Variovorax sp. ZS18.2.2]
MMTLKKLALRAVFAGTAVLGLASAQAALPIQQWTLANGAKIYLVSTNALPIVDVQIDFDAGSRRDPAPQAGLASVTSAMVEKGVRAGKNGEPALDQNALGEAWADLGASFDVSAGTDRMSYSLRTLSDPALLGKAVTLASRELGEPSFPDDVWLRERERINASIKESNTKPATIAGRAFAQAVYGVHPYGQEVTEETLARIDTVAMRQRYQQLIVPCRAKLSIVGAVTRTEAESVAVTLLSRLPAADSCAPLPTIAPVAALAAQKDERIPFDSAQAHVFIGQPGYPRKDPDHFALTLGNYVLGGGGFVSRLTNEVREKRGLTYSIYSGFAPGLDAGAFRIGFQTRPDQAEEAVKMSREVLAKFVAEGPTESELKAAKDNLIGGFPLLLDSNRKLIGNVANIAWHDLPLDYLDTWTTRMNAVTAADVKAAFARKLQPARMVTVVVGGK